MSPQSSMRRVEPADAKLTIVAKNMPRCVAGKFQVFPPKIIPMNLVHVSPEDPSENVIKWVNRVPPLRFPYTRLEQVGYTCQASKDMGNPI